MPRILPALRAALRALPPYDPEGRPWNLLLYEAEQQSSAALPQLLALFDSLRSDHRITSREGKLQMVDSGGRSFDLTWLAHWLLRQSHVHSPKWAVAGLRRFLRTSTFPFLRVFALEGLTVNQSFALEPNLRLISWNELPESDMRQNIFTTFAFGAGFHHPTAALVHSQRLAVTYDGTGAASTIFDPRPIDAALLVLAMATKSAPAIIATWLEPPAWAPIHSGAFTFPVLEGFRPLGAVGASHVGKTQRLLRLFRNLASRDRDRCELVLKRLHLAQRRRYPVDRAIDLGIALEALFLADQQDDRGELSFRLRVRASRFLHRTPSERKRAFALIGDLYTLRSKAVHTGRIPDTYRKRPVMDILDEGISLGIEAAEHLLRNPRPDWDHLVLG